MQAGSRLCASKDKHLCRSMACPRKGQAVHPSFVEHTSRLVLRGLRRSHNSLEEKQNQWIIAFVYGATMSGLGLYK